MEEFKRNAETGILESWKDGKKVGEIVTMEDILTPDWNRTEKESDEE